MQFATAAHFPCLFIPTVAITRTPRRVHMKFARENQPLFDRITCFYTNMLDSDGKTWDAEFPKIQGLLDICESCEYCGWNIGGKERRLDRWRTPWIIDKINTVFLSFSKTRKTHHKLRFRSSGWIIRRKMSPVCFGSQWIRKKYATRLHVYVGSPHLNTRPHIWPGRRKELSKPKFSPKLHKSVAFSSALQISTSHFQFY